MDLNALSLPELVPDTMRARRFRMARTVMALMLREMSTTYGRSPGGYIWALLEPILGVTFLVFVFSFMMRDPPLGNSFALFYASGFMPFMAFNDIANKVATSVRYSKPLLQYPVVTYFDAMLARMLLTVFSHTVVMVLIMAGIIIMEDTRAHIQIGNLVQAVGMLMALAFGVGTINAFLMAAFPIWERLWTILTKPLMLVSGIFFTYASLPLQAQQILWYNPLMHIIGMFRSGIYHGYDNSYVDQGYIYGLSMSLMVLGMMLLNRHHLKMMNEM